MTVEELLNNVVMPGYGFFLVKCGDAFAREAGIPRLSGELRSDLNLLVTHMDAVRRCIRFAALPGGMDAALGQTSASFVADRDLRRRLFQVLTTTDDPKPVIVGRDILLARCREKHKRFFAGRNQPLASVERKLAETGYVAYGLFGYDYSTRQELASIAKDHYGFELVLFVHALDYLDDSIGTFKLAAGRGSLTAPEKENLSKRAGTSFGFCEEAIPALHELGITLIRGEYVPDPVTNFRPEKIELSESGVGIKLRWELPLKRCDSVTLECKGQGSSDWRPLFSAKKRDDYTYKATLLGESVEFRVRSVWQGVTLDAEKSPALKVVVPDEPKVESCAWTGDKIHLAWRPARNSVATWVFERQSESPKVIAGRSIDPAVRSNKVQATSFDISEVEADRTCCFLLVGEYSDGVFSFGSPISVKVPAAPPPPTKVQAEYLFDPKSGVGHVQISVPASANPSTCHYRLIRYGYANANVLIDTELEIKGASNQTTWVDNTAAAGAQYVYRVVPSLGKIFGKWTDSPPITVAPGVWDLHLEPADRTVVFTYKTDPLVEEVCIRRCEGPQKPLHHDDGTPVPAKAMWARDSSLATNQSYNYLISCRYNVGGVALWSKPQELSNIIPKIRPQAASLDLRLEDSKILCALGDPRTGELTVRRLTKSHGLQKGQTIPLSQLETIGTDIGTLSGRLAKDSNPDPRFAYYAAFTISESEGFAIVGDCKKCSLVPDIIGLKWFAVSGGVRLTWIWPEWCDSTLVLAECDRAPPHPTCEWAGNHVQWKQGGKVLTPVRKPTYVEDGDSYFLPLGADDGQGHWKVKVLAVVQDNCSQGEDGGCQCEIKPTPRTCLEYTLQLKGTQIAFAWRVTPANSEPFGFVVVGNETKIPSNSNEGQRVIEVNRDISSWPQPDGSGFRHLNVPCDSFSENQYYRLFGNPAEPVPAHLAIHHPESLYPPLTDKVLPSFTRLHWNIARKPRRILCPYCFEEFAWWHVLLRTGDGVERPLSWWWRFGAVIQPGKGAPDAVLQAPAASKVCPNHCREMRSGGKIVDLDNALFLWQSLHIGLVGGVKAGKSHWILGATRRLAGFGLSTIGKHTKERLDEMKRRVIDSNSPLDRTLRPDDSEIVPPLLFEANCGLDKITLGLCDVDGDRWGAYGEAGKMRYLCASHALVFIVDPLQIRSFREMMGSSLPEDAPPENECTDQQEPLNELLRALRQRSVPKYNVPIAVVVSKGDVLKDAVPIVREAIWERPLYQRTSGTPAYDLNLHWTVQFAVRDFLLKYEPNLVSMVEHNFKHFAYFCVAPTGSSARTVGKTKRFARFAPWRVEEPVLWLLCKLGVIPPI